MIKNYTLEQLPEIAEEVLKFSKNKVLLFYGEMGVGKTTLIKDMFLIDCQNSITK